jgi:hypothetical protein
MVRSCTQSSTIAHSSRSRRRARTDQQPAIIAAKVAAILLLLMSERMRWAEMRPATVAAACDASNPARLFSHLQKDTGAGADVILSRRVGSFGRRRKWRWVAFRLPLRSLPERLERDVKHRDQKDTDSARRQHADEDRCADATAGNFGSTVCPY